MRRLIKHLSEGNTLKALTAAYTILVTVLFLMPGTDVPGIDIPYLDKWAHIGMFFVLSALWSFMVVQVPLLQNIKKFPLFLLLLIYGMVIELIQHTLLPSRSADPWDVLANTIGILLGMWAAQKIQAVNGLKV